MNDEIKTILAISLLCFLIGACATFDGWLDMEQKIEMERVRCAK